MEGDFLLPLKLKRERSDGDDISPVTIFLYYLSKNKRIGGALSVMAGRSAAVAFLVMSAKASTKGREINMYEAQANSSGR